MNEWAKGRLNLSSPESAERFLALRNSPERLDDNEELRKALLDFIADFANWDNSTVPDYLETSRALTHSAHESLGGEPGTRPLVLDPFAGGGSIPLEALRVGADTFASDLNPIPILLNILILTPRIITPFTQPTYSPVHDAQIPAVSLLHGRVLLLVIRCLSHSKFVRKIKAPCRRQGTLNHDIRRH